MNQPALPSQPAPIEPRQLTPVQTFWGKSKPGVKDFRPGVIPANAIVPKPKTLADEEAEEVEETLTPAPKDVSAQGSVSSPDLAQTSSPVASALPVLPLPEVTTAPDVDSENGKASESNAVAPPTSPTTPPAPAPSSPNSSSEKKSGNVTPPAVASPPISATNQTP